MDRTDYSSYSYLLLLMAKPASSITSKVSARNGRGYDEKFKRDAVRRREQSGLSRAKVARDLGISSGTLATWEAGYGSGPTEAKAESAEMAKPRTHNILPDINFGSIRPLGGKQTAGFEELSVQLFRGETEGKGEFFAIEGSGGDGGVEAYRTSPDGNKIAVQSKYFSSLGTTQWQQISESVKTALKNHPTLRAYTVSTPLNRTPVQTVKWNELTVEWLAHAAGLGIAHTVEFIWWGYSELAQFLVKERYRSQLVYWLGVPDFSLNWLSLKNQSKIELLGKRYSPKEHIETDTGLRLEAFAWADDSKERILSAFLKLSKNWTELNSRELDQAKLSHESEKLTNAFCVVMQGITSFRWPASGYPSVRALHDTCREANAVCDELVWELRKLNWDEKGTLAKKRGVSADQLHGPYEFLIRDLQRLGDTIIGLQKVTEICTAADDFKLLLLGEAGSGKSHLIADIVTSASNRSQPSLLLLGEQYSLGEDPWTATIKLLGWQHSADDLLAALDQAGRIAGRPALLCVDALNESSDRQLWHSYLIEFAERVSRYRHVKLLVSCRSDFTRITLPEPVRPGGSALWPVVQHQGYGAEVIEAIEVYFREFRVRAPYFPPALAEFRNPLFLRVFCEAFSDQEFPVGPLGLHQVMQARIARLCDQIQKEIDCHPDDTRAALKAIAKEIAENGGRPIPRSTARKRASDCFAGQNASTSLYTRLLSNSILVETAQNASDVAGEQEVVVRFPFERFSDYFIALQIFDGVKTADHFRALLGKGGRLAHLQKSWEYYQNRGIARALAILGPERLQMELAEMLTDSSVREMVLEDFLESMAWRSSDSLSQASETILEEARRAELEVLPTFIRLSSIPGHPFNSNFLGAWLTRLPLPERELAWTLPIASLSHDRHDGILHEFLDWCFRAPTNLIPDEQALLAGRLLLWLCTSNHRALRKRATIAAIRLLVGRPKVVSSLLSELHNVDDPYLIERLYAVAAGVAMRLPAGEGLSSLAAHVHQLVFAHGQVTPNILVRDFATTVLETCLAKGCLPASIHPASFHPPFKSQWPTIIPEDDVKRFKEDDSWLVILSSLRTEDMGNYGDFGRYVMDAKVHYFSDRLLSESPPNHKDRTTFECRAARRWILQRVEELGWTGARFGEYEKHTLHGRQSPDIEELKLERVSKKYQWIALRELIGFLADRYWLRLTWQSNRTDFVGAWQLWAREFDPSQRLVDPGNEKLSNTVRTKFQVDYPNPFEDPMLCNDRAAWVTQSPADFASLLIVQKDTPDASHRWLVLGGHQQWVEDDYDRLISKNRGTLKMWVDIRSFLVAAKDRDQFLEGAKSKHFYGNGVGFPEEHRGWIGEYPRGEVFRNLVEQCAELDDRVGEVGVPYTITVSEWSGGATLVPSPQLCDILELEWAGEGGAFRTKHEACVAGHLGGDAADWGRPLLIRQDFLMRALKAAGLELVWCIVAERSCWCSRTSTHIAKKQLEVSAVYWLEDGQIEGGLTQTFVQEIPEK